MVFFLHFFHKITLF